MALGRPQNLLPACTARLMQSSSSVIVNRLLRSFVMMRPILPHVHINYRYSTRVQSVNGEDSHLEKPVSQQTDDVTRHR